MGRSRKADTRRTADTLTDELALLPGDLRAAEQRCRIEALLFTAP